MPPTTEKRLFERYEIDFDADLVLDKETEKSAKIAFKTVNLSAGGAYFKTQELFPAGTRVSIVLYVPETRGGEQRTKSIIEVTGIILRSDPHGIAAKFDKGYKIHPP